jgi:hypothetical protein
MDDVRNTKKIYQANLHKKRTGGRPMARGTVDVENDVRRMGIVNWRKVAQNRDVC